MEKLTQAPTWGTEWHTTIQSLHRFSWWQNIQLSKLLPHLIGVIGARHKEEKPCEGVLIWAGEPPAFWPCSTKGNAWGKYITYWNIASASAKCAKFIHNIRTHASTAIMQISQIDKSQWTCNSFLTVSSEVIQGQMNREIPCFTQLQWHQTWITNAL